MMAPTPTFPFFPLWTLFFNAGHQGRIKIRVQAIVNYGVILAAPVRFHNHGSALVLMEQCLLRELTHTISDLPTEREYDVLNGGTFYGDDSSSSSWFINSVINYEDLSHMHPDVDYTVICPVTISNY